MKALITLIVLFFVVQAQSETVAEKRRRVENTQSQIRSTERVINSLRAEDILMHEWNSAINNRWHLLNNMYLVSQRNEDSLEGFYYLLLDFNQKLDELSRNLSEVPSPEGELQSQASIRSTVASVLTQFQSRPNDLTREDVEELIQFTLEAYQSISSSLVNIQFNISYQIESHQNTNANRETVINRLNDEIRQMQTRRPVIHIGPTRDRHGRILLVP